jgi:hypothetical protein
MMNEVRSVFRQQSRVLNEMVGYMLANKEDICATPAGKVEYEQESMRCILRSRHSRLTTRRANRILRRFEFEAGRVRWWQDLMHAPGYNAHPDDHEWYQEAVARAAVLRQKYIELLSNNMPMETDCQELGHRNAAMLGKTHRAHRVKRL